MEYRYQPYYCEENIWHLCEHAELQHLERRVVFISNQSGRCALWFQRAQPTVGLPLFWDYHVILAVSDGQLTEVFDLDSTLPCPLNLDDYLRNTFTGLDMLPAEFAPQFRVISAADYLTHFASDRKHMITAQGSFHQPPPPWPVIGEGKPPTLARFIDMSQGYLGEVFDLERFSQTGGRQPAVTFD